MPSVRGRFAPSPTGLLHAGSLTTAVGSFLEARTRGGQWLVRIEDLDPPREVPGAADEILRTLERLGFEWDGDVVYQSRRHDLYRDALDTLRRAGSVYPCTCTRREIGLVAHRGIDGPVYPGTCRGGCRESRSARAWRLRVGEDPVSFDDRLQGRVSQSLENEVGDIVLRRADGFWAYQLAVVVDDAEQGVTDIVRGADLLVSTPRQIAVYRALGQAVPGYCHLPVMVNAAGEKLSKQTLAPAIDPDEAVKALCQALRRLGHTPPADPGSVAEVWAWAMEHWSISRVPAAPVTVIS
ncbi:tRNA glutamyl-Q(34) synthetase GluQRS [Paludibacterium paludis]|uniref:Glutamyl-Q tRNA(Asp) synthetase n=1 Tax=Paludibacterium paludis TaxID=1225769 RepID=A0A918P0F0_9NEIS|nr:tRNA glutamyl-Q(34) synthetase GluQRS [Paludibacterium paludis]GGY10399.1 glutamyl-Q tRNA(Asp) synthetase [Paludibacterium paludis]